MQTNSERPQVARWFKPGSCFCCDKIVLNCSLNICKFKIFPDLRLNHKEVMMLFVIVEGFEGFSPSSVIHTF